MARKDLLKGLMEAPAPVSKTSEETRVDVEKPRYTKGAIGAVSQSIADLKARSMIEVDPKMIDEGGAKDRLEEPSAEFEALKASLLEYGQQVPVLVRPNPNYPERYQVVYGRRRIAALRALGLPVKALVRVLNDAELLMAQGQENAARRDLTFIEKANFARTLRDGGYDRKAICDALHVDKTVISRMLNVADKIPMALIETIGAAPSVGRDRWIALAEKIGEKNLISAALGDTSDARFDAVLNALKKPRAPTPAPVALKTSQGTQIAEVKRKGGKTLLSFDQKVNQGFDDWLVDNLERIRADWAKTQESGE